MLGILILTIGLPIFSYLALIYRELGRMTTGRIHEHLEIFEAEIEPKLHINRRSGGRTFRILGHFWLAFLVLETTRGVVHFVPQAWESVVQFVVFLTLEVVIAMHFVPDMLLYRTTGRWLLRLLPAVRLFMWLVWPVRVFLEGAESLARISEKDIEKSEEQRTEEGIEALVEAAEEEGIIEPEQADLIEQVVEFSDKRVREVMTPRPDIVAIAAEATLEELHAKFVEKKFSQDAGVRKISGRYFWRGERAGFAAYRGSGFAKAQSAGAGAAGAFHSGDKSGIGSAARDAAERSAPGGGDR